MNEEKHVVTAFLGTASDAQLWIKHSSHREAIVKITTLLDLPLLSLVGPRLIYHMVGLRLRLPSFYSGSCLIYSSGDFPLSSS